MVQVFEVQLQLLQLLLQAGDGELRVVQLLVELGVLVFQSSLVSLHDLHLTTRRLGCPRAGACNFEALLLELVEEGAIVVLGGGEAALHCMKLPLESILRLVIFEAKVSRGEDELVQVLDLMIQLRALGFEPSQTFLGGVQIFEEAVLSLLRNLQGNPLATFLGLSARVLGLGLGHTEPADLVSCLVSFLFHRLSRGYGPPESVLLGVEFLFDSDLGLVETVVILFQSLELVLSQEENVVAGLALAAEIYVVLVKLVLQILDPGFQELSVLVGLGVLGKASLEKFSCLFGLALQLRLLRPHGHELSLHIAETAGCLLSLAAEGFLLLFEAAAFCLVLLVVAAEQGELALFLAHEIFVVGRGLRQSGQLLVDLPVLGDELLVLRLRGLQLFLRTTQLHLEILVNLQQLTLQVSGLALLKGQLALQHLDLFLQNRLLLAALRLLLGDIVNGPLEIRDPTGEFRLFVLEPLDETSSLLELRSVLLDLFFGALLDIHETVQLVFQPLLIVESPG